jgi:mycoredoxin
MWMASMRLDRWLPLLVALVAGLAVAVASFLDGQEAWAVVIVLAFAALAWWSWPNRTGTHLSHAQAQATAGDGDVIVYWRPGCHYCSRLRFGLGRQRSDVTWVNIWRDGEAASFVAARRDGTETVPTAVTGAGELLPATPQAIKAQLAARR